MLDKIEEPEDISPALSVRQRLAARKNGGGYLTTKVMVQGVLMVLVLAAGLFGMNALTALREVPPSRPPFKSVYVVDSLIAKSQTVQPILLVYGEVQAAESVELRALVAGKIISVNPDLKVGARVEKDSELLRIDPFTYEKDLATAKANLTETTARIEENRARIKIEESKIRSLGDQLELAEKDLQRIEALKARGTASSKQTEDRSLVVTQRRQSLEQAQFNLVAEQSRLSQLEATMLRYDWNRKQAEKNLQDTILKAPLAGIINQKNASQGRLISANDVVVSMYDADSLEVRFTLTDQRFGRINTDKDGVIGRNVEVIWSVGNEEFRFPAKIDRLGATITSDRGGVEVIAVITEGISGSSLRPGAFVEVLVPDRKFEGKFRIPETALYDGHTVYVIKEGKLVARTVSLLARDGTHVIASGEIAEGDEVMTTHIAEISEGLRVKSQSAVE